MDLAGQAKRGLVWLVAVGLVAFTVWLVAGP